MQKVISLLSGGLDSTVATTIANKKMNVCLAMTFNYGQLSAKNEIKYSSKICEILKVKHKTIPLPWLKNITQTSLVRGGIPELSINDLESEKIFETAKQVWVPNRNGVFLNIGASFAEAMKCDYLVVGFDAEEAVTFPDNSKNFTKAVEKSLSFSTLNKVKIYAPLISMQKHEIVQKGLEEKAPLEWSWSCYYSTPRPCMKCESCVRRARAFEEAGVKDPLLLRLK